MAVDSSGNVVVAWIKSGQTETIIKPISTGVWSSITTFTTTGSSNPSIALGGGVTTIIWQAHPSTQDQIMSSTSTSIGGSFSTPLNIIGVANSGHNHGFPKVSVDLFGNSIAVWFRSDFGGSSNTDYINVVVLGTLLVKGASAWGIPVLVSDLGTRNPSDLILRASFDPVGNGYILWTSSTNGSVYNIECSSKQVGGNLNPFFQIIGSNLLAKDASISISSLSDVLIVYQFYDGTNSVIQAIETDIGGSPLNVYTPASTLSVSSTNNAQPRASISLTGTTVNAIAVWQSYDSINNTTIIQAATGSKPLLGAPTGLMVSQNTNNFGVFNEFDNVSSWTASTDPNVIGYNIYRDSIFIGQIGSSTTSFTDSNRTQSGTGVTVTYNVASLDNNFQQSQRVNVNIS
jgi:hypothetical protein